MRWHVKHVANVVVGGGGTAASIFGIGQRDEWSKGSYLFKFTSLFLSLTLSFACAAAFACFVPFLTDPIRIDAEHHQIPISATSASASAIKKRETEHISASL